MTARSGIRNILDRFPLQPLWKIEASLHILWYTFARAASIIPADHPAQDRLAAEVILARELGSLDSDERTAATEDGRIWSDLPYLIRDLDVFWLSNQQDLSVDECRNLAAFRARLAALGVRTPELCVCALRVLDGALGEDEEYGESETAKGEASGFSTTAAAAARLVPAAVEWVRHAGHRLAMLSLREGFEGFSVARWTLWHRRFQAVHQDDNQDEDVRELARRGMNNMNMWSGYVGIPNEIKAVARNG